MAENVQITSYKNTSRRELQNDGSDVMDLVAYETLSAVQISVLIVNQSDEIVFANEKAHKLLQASHDELSDAPIDAFIKADWASLKSQPSHAQSKFEIKSLSGKSITVMCGVCEVDSAHSLIFLQDISDKTAIADYLNHLAKTDPLTGIANRSQVSSWLIDALHETNQDSFEAHLDQKFQDKTGVLIIGLDGFKRINDALGHDVGDQVLQITAMRLKKITLGNQIGRVAGDEFIVVLQQQRNTIAFAKLADKIIQCISEPIHIDQQDIYIHPSIGIALYPDHALTADSLLRAGESALTLAKNKGGSRYQFFTEALDNKTKRRLDIDRRLRHAIANDELSLVYQPQIHAKTGELVAMEALLRFHNVELDQVSPADFIPIAEETGLIIEIGKWVIEEATKTLADWRNQGMMIERLAINISMKQITASHCKSFMQHVFKTCQRHGIPHSSLVLEVTETAIMEDPSQAIQTLALLKRHGFNVALDDFGTGYSSLTYIQELPLDELKLDRVFVSRIPGDDTTEALVKLVTKLGQVLNLHVVAEGVETKEQADFLKKIGCHTIQGYYYSPPLCYEEISKYLRTHHFPDLTANKKQLKAEPLLI